MALVFIRKEDSQEVIPLEQSAGSSAEGIAIHPFDHHLAALIGKVKSVQGIWFENLSEEPVLFSRPPDIAFKNGSVFDIQWDPSGEDRKSTRLNSSHVAISYAVFCLKKKN